MATGLDLFAENNSAIKKSLVLSGGGMRLSYQAGVLLAIHEQRVNFFHNVMDCGKKNLRKFLRI